MRRSALALIVITAFMAVPLAAKAQRADKVYRIGFLRAGSPPKAWVEGLQQGLRERGYVDGQNVVVDFGFTHGTTNQLPQLAQELVRSKVDVILTSAGDAAQAAKDATTTVPIVFMLVTDPVAVGLVASLARPGGNITGLATTSAQLAGKRLELLRELVPKLRRVAVLWDRANPTNPVQLNGARVAARTLDIQLESVPVRDPNDLDAGFKVMRGADGLLQLDSALFINHRARIVELTARNRLPAVYGFRETAEVGGLMSYGPDIPDIYRRAATYVDKILKGANAGDLPIEQPSKYDLRINLKTAKALGLTIPQSLLLRADQVIE